ncbi:MAG: hypothetical protein K2X35_11005 [Bryobacteraceae bacterium]|nr:hypothetical protein [Bryobacteraceae bacterium]
MPRVFFFILIGAAAVALAVGLIFYSTADAHLELRGEILQTRVLPLEESSVLAVLDFRATNPSRLRYVVQQVSARVQKEDGQWVDGITISRTDMNRVFEVQSQVGAKHNEMLVLKDGIAPGATVDRMAAARFPLPEAEFEKRRGLVLRVQEIDARGETEVSELKEKR